MAAPWYEDAGNRSAMQSEIHLNADRAGENLMVSEDRRTVTQTGNTQHFDGAWILASGPGSAGLTRGRWVCTFTVKRRRRWMAVGFAMDSIKLNKPINRNNIFVYASTGSCKANEHVRDFDADRDGDGDTGANSAWSAFGCTYKAGDVIKAYLDLEDGTLGFACNAGPAKEAYARLRSTTLFPAIYVSGNLDAVEFDCRKLVDPIENPSFLRFLDADPADDLGVDAVTFVVGGRRIRAHKFVLAARSEYFRAMLNTRRLRAARADGEGDAPDDEVQVVGADYDTFATVLRFIYSGGDAPIPPESVVDIFKLASEYTLRTLAVKCLDIMCDSVTVENALSIFSLSEAHLPLTDRLKAKCVEVIRDNVKEVSQSPSFADLCTDPELVKQLIVPLASPPRKRARTCDSAD